MKKGKKTVAFLAGMVAMLLICAVSIPALAIRNTTSLNDVLVGGIRIVIDGQELHPTDVNGNPVDPMIYNGTTYLPVRAVASALGKAVAWDGPSYTVYLGNMEGKLEYPTVMLKDMTSITVNFSNDNKLTDNYGNTYGSALYPYFYYNGNNGSELVYEYLLNMKYSRFKGTLYVPEGTTSDKTDIFTITADGRQIYASPIMSKTSQPVYVNVDVTGYNDVKLAFSGKNLSLHLADAGFYQ